MNKINISKFDNLTANQWDEKIFYRAVNGKFPDQLRSLVWEVYPQRIEKVKNMLDIRQQLDTNKLLPIIDLYGLEKIKDLEEAGIDLRNYIDKEIQRYSKQVDRLIDKYAVCSKMFELREKKQVPNIKEWEMHGTIYYIDLDAGNDGAAGTAIGTAWLTIEKYTSVAVRSAGDIGKVRAGTSEVWATADDVDFDENGAVGNRITLKGCTVADDPWSDSSDVNPIFDFNDTTYHFDCDVKYWEISDMDFIQSGEAAGGCFVLYNDYDAYVHDCRFYDNADMGLEANTFERVLVENCEFWNNIDKNFHTAYGNRNVVKGCIFNGGAGGTLYGAYFGSSFASPPVLIDCTFGQTTAHGTADIYFRDSQRYFMRNCIYDSIFLNTGAESEGALILTDDDNGVFEAHKNTFLTGVVERDTSVVRSGGADSSAKCSPTSIIDESQPFTLSGHYYGHPFGALKVWLEASVEKTISIYLRGFTWSSWPTAAQLYLRAEYYGSGANCIRTILDSDEVLSDNTTWVAFQVTLTPARTGFVYLDIFCSLYEASSGFYVDIKPVIT